MDDLNKPLILDNEYSPKKNKNSDNLSNDEIQKKSFQLLGEEELPLDTEKIIQEAETTSVFKKEIAEKNEGIIIKDGDADTKKIKKIKINHDLKKDFIDAKEETLKINHFINEQKKQLKLLHEEGLEIDQEMLNFEKNKNQLQVEFIDKQKKLIDKNEEEIKKLKILNQEYQEKISSSEEFIGNLKIKEENFKNLSQKYIEKIAKQEEIINNFKTKEEEIKFYQNDNLRLSNELFEVSKKLEDHKVRMNEFENNKSQIQEQIYNINKIISKNNIVKDKINQFAQNRDTQNISEITINEKPDIELDISDQDLEEKNQDLEEKNKEFEEVNEKTKNIFAN